MYSSFVLFSLHKSYLNLFDYPYKVDISVNISLLGIFFVFI